MTSADMASSAVSASPEQKRERQHADVILPPKIIESVIRSMETYRSEVGNENPGARETGQGHVQLPFDVIEVIARFLADEARVKGVGHPGTALARLNRVSKACHQVTLPALYETTDYYDEEDFSKSVKLEDPKGWKWTRYLLLGAISSPLFCQQQRHSRNLYTISEKDLDLELSFPRLRLACHLGAARNMPVSNRGYGTEIVDVAVEIFKPIAFEELENRCRPRGGRSWDIFCVFGINPPFPTPPAKIPYDKRAGSVIKLIVAEGAGILPPPKCHAEGRPWNVANGGIVEAATETFTLILRDSTPTKLTASTIEFVLEFLEFGAESTLYEFGLEPRLVVECNPSVFPAIVTSLDPAKLIPNLTIKLLGTVNSENDIVQLLQTLAEFLTPHYVFDRDNDGRDFVTLTCSMPVPAGIVPYSPGGNDCEFRITGSLQDGLPMDQWEGAGDWTGFTLTVVSSLMFADGNSSPTNFRHYQRYPERYRRL